MRCLQGLKEILNNSKNACCRATVSVAVNNQTAGHRPALQGVVVGQLCQLPFTRQVADLPYSSHIFHGKSQTCPTAAFHKFRQQGMTLLELMVALAIGAVLLVGLATVFFNSSRTHRELEKSGQMIENGRYAISVLYEDLRHAGFYGYFFDLDAAPATLPDPCAITTLVTLGNAMAQPVQGYNAAATNAYPTNITDTTCDEKNLLDEDVNLLSRGSDVLVIRRADTAVFTGVIDNTPTNDVGAIYLQANGQASQLKVGANGADIPTDNADGVAYVSTNPAHLRKYPSSTTNTAAADTRKYHVHVYFVAPCSAGTGAAGVCVNTNPRLPTLKRLELSSDGTNAAMSIVPLVEGIEYFKVEYGIDTTPTAVDPSTHSIGDGVPDTYVASPSAAQWGNVVTVRVHILARNVKSTDDYTDDKTYTLAGVDFGPFGDRFKRHVFSTEVRPMNMGGRREIPK